MDMKVIKKINNNVAICLDNDNHELVAFGKGIGFGTMPYELQDLSRVQRTYYGINLSYLGLLDEIPDQVFEVSAKIVDQARAIIHNEMNANIVFTLADHINFAMERYKKKMSLKMPFSHDIQHLYEEEMLVGEIAVKIINQEMNIHLAKDEAISIALHFINAETMQMQEENKIDEGKIIEDITNLIETDFALVIDREGFNYSRFVTHLQYLLKRKESDTRITSENQKMYEAMKKDFIKTYECVEHVKDYLMASLSWNPGDEEMMYLMLHINRLCAREDCNR